MEIISVYMKGYMDFNTITCITKVWTHSVGFTECHADPPPPHPRKAGPLRRQTPQKADLLRSQTPLSGKNPPYPQQKADPPIIQST